MIENYFERLLPWIRSQFPQVECLRSGERRVYLDNAAGTLVPQTVADAIRDAALWNNPQPGRAWPPSPETLDDHRATRGLLRDFLNADASDPIFISESTTASLYKLREAVEPSLGLPGANVVVTDCDHFANISPWESRPRWQVRRARATPEGSLDLDHLSSVIDTNTRLVAMTLAGNGLGTILPVAEAAALVRKRAPEALVVVDAVHAAPHLPIDVATLGVDALAFSTYKLFGPNAGVLWLRRELFSAMAPFRVEPHVDPETRMEWGTLSNISVAGIRAALDYLLRLAGRLEPQFVGKLTAYPRRRRRFKLVLAAVQAYEQALSRRVLEALGEMAGIQLFGVVDPARASQRVPTFAFSLAGVPDAALEARLWETNRLQIGGGSHYSAMVTRGLGRAAVGRASFAHYNCPEDVAAFIAALRRLSGNA